VQRISALRPSHIRGSGHAGGEKLPSMHGWVIIIEPVGGMGKTALAAGAVLVTLGSALAWQMPWREYPGQDNIEVPPDYQEKTEWVFARLMYPPYMGLINGRGFRGGFRGADWKHGRSSWTTDYTSADRHVAVAIRRLTRVHVR